MDCARCREVLSAELDGEASAAETAVAGHHLASCPSCRTHRATIAVLHRTVRVAPAEPVPDLTARILAAAPNGPDGASAADAADTPVWRLGLGLVAAAQLLAAAAHLDADHLARDQASWEAAVAAGFAWAAWRPHRTAGLLPVAVVLTLLLLVNGGVAAGSAGSHHLLAPVGLVLLLLTTRPWSRPRALA